jgi:hypothetical protein
VTLAWLADTDAGGYGKLRAYTIMPRLAGMASASRVAAQQGVDDLGVVALVHRGGADEVAEEGVTVRRSSARRVARPSVESPESGEVPRPAAD